MTSRTPFIKSGLDNFPLCEDIYNIVPLPIITYSEPAVGLKNNPNTCRLVRDVTKSPPTFEKNPLCFTLPNQNEIDAIFIAAMRGTVQWNQISCIETDSNTHNVEAIKLGRTSYHDKIWRFHCPCSGKPRKQTPQPTPETVPQTRLVNTTFNKDGSIDIRSKNVKAVQTVTTSIDGVTKKTVVATEVTGDPWTQGTPVKTRQRKESIKCECPARFFIRRRIDNAQYEVEWHWNHVNHNPFSLHDMRRMRASGPLKSWLTEKVLGGMPWPTLRKLLRNSDLNRVSTHMSLPPSLEVDVADTIV